MKKLSKDDKRKLWKDTKSYHVAAVLDKASSFGNTTGHLISAVRCPCRK